MSGLKSFVEALRGPKNLPATVQASIACQDHESETLVSYIQLAVILIFIALYSLAPQPGNADAEFFPIPWVLGTYLAFTVIKVLAAQRWILPGWVVSVSVFADMMLLMATIWSFHIQYMQPPAFYLKAPTILYVFIFIALRALRFDIRYLVLAGVTAAVGWAILVGYVMINQMSNRLITRDYVEYITSNALLIGAEMDKVISILLVTLILALAIWRARAFLVRSVTEASAARSLSQFFPKAVAERISADDGTIKSGKGDLRDAAILTMDIRGFTHLSTKLSPDALVALLTEYQSRVVPIIQDHNGAVDKFLGDGILASFGVVTDCPDYAAKAVKAAEAIIKDIDLWNAERAAAGKTIIGVGIGLSVGRIVFGIIGSSDRLEYTVLGNAVNLAAKLEAHNKVEQSRALCSEDAYSLAKSQGYQATRGHELVLDRSVGGVQDKQNLVILCR